MLNRKGKQDNDGIFSYGQVAQGDQFTDREKEREKLAALLKNGSNVILISPRRWGKTSLVRQLAQDMHSDSPKTVFCFIDLFDVRTELEFYEILALHVLKATESKWQGQLDAAKTYLAKLIPKFSFSPDAMQEFSLSFGWEQTKAHYSDVLNLGERIAKEKNIRLVICIDEFQNLNQFEDPLAFQKRLRSHWQHHTQVTYCLYGSKRHMMLEVFSLPDMPFYKFGELMFLHRIAEEDWVRFIQSRFEHSQKSIEEDAARLIAQLVENHPHYVQQLSQQVWFRTQKKATTQTVFNAFDDLIHQLNLFFQHLVDQLTTPQLNYLDALLDGVEHMSSKETLERYSLGTSANIARIKKALIQKEVLDFVEEDPLFLDPVFKAWLTSYYFKKKAWYEP